ncbi:MAG: terpene cyclase/mutase family protein [Deltaproteobacteria bacterium]|nr:terpene cyclase/mutase family protein [Deltaproteobacteria bacterium]
MKLSRMRAMLNAQVKIQSWRHWRVLTRDLARPSSQPERPNHIHLEAAIEWLIRAQDIRNGEVDAGGVSAGWTFADGWLPSYPETSGYIVETWLAAARVLNRETLRLRARRILDWELSIQCESGAFPGHFGESGSEPVIFNTGQIMHGLIAGHLEFGGPSSMPSPSSSPSSSSTYLEAAHRAGQWMLEKQDPDGCWRRSTHNNIPHTYNTRAAWALLRTGILTGDTALIDGCRLALSWAEGQVTTSGWFRSNGFRSGDNPFTHTIAYAMRGFLEAGILLGQEKYIEIARVAANALVEAQREDGFLAGEFGGGWRPQGDYCCLTGLAQTALVWRRLDQIGVEGRWSSAVERALRFLKRNHAVSGTGGPEDGSLAGSVPLWGRYSRFEYPNWATKFFADLLLMMVSDEIIPPVIIPPPPL